MTPKKVSNLVDRLYDKMDALSHEFGVYKLETIGDAWVSVWVALVQFRFAFYLPTVVLLIPYTCSSAPICSELVQMIM